MDRGMMSKRSFRTFSGLSGIIGVVLILVSFNINPGPPPGATSDELLKSGQQYYAAVLWGAWLQAVGPVFIVLSHMHAQLLNFFTKRRELGLRSSSSTSSGCDRSRGSA